jgi:hypothetical protein
MLCYVIKVIRCSWCVTAWLKSMEEYSLERSSDYQVFSVSLFAVIIFVFKALLLICRTL